VSTRLKFKLRAGMDDQSPKIEIKD